jgi:hypothetical protein
VLIAIAAVMHCQLGVGDDQHLRKLPVAVQ